jgi:hypothetical protein
VVSQNKKEFVYKELNIFRHTMTSSGVTWKSSDTLVLDYYSGSSAMISFFFRARSVPAQIPEGWTSKVFICSLFLIQCV